MPIQLDADGNIVLIKNKKNPVIAFIENAFKFVVGTAIVLTIIIVFLAVLLGILIAVFAIPIAIAWILLSMAGII